MLQPEVIHKANIEAHKLEASIYEQRHPEIYGYSEQKRITKTLQIITVMIEDNEKHALDFGAGTGNLTGRLLRLGYKVTAVDISPDMCVQLKKKFQQEILKGNLKVVNSEVEEFKTAAKYDLITCYSVLHHLPDYIQTIKELAALLHTGGCMYLDHEASPYYWTNQNFRGIERIINFSNRIVDFPFRFRRGTKISIDYNMSDYWTSKDRHIDHKKIERAFIQLHFSIHRRIDYHVSKTLVVNPAFIAYQLLMKPTTSCWIAKK